MSNAIGGLMIVLFVWTIAMCIAILSVGLPLLFLAKLAKWVLT